MLKRDEIVEILKQAKRVDSRYELFGAKKHKYQLNPPISTSFVRAIEEKYEFSLPEDYFRFITEIGDGGAGTDYGIYPFADLVKKRQERFAERHYQNYRNSLKNAFTPRPMLADEFEEFSILKSDYEQNPEQYFIYQNSDEERQCHLDGFYVLGTHGCAWDFGMVITGEMRGKVFTTDNTGAYCLEADSFEEFYQNWLDRINAKKLKEELEKRREFWKKIQPIQ